MATRRRPGWLVCALARGPGVPPRRCWRCSCCPPDGVRVFAPFERALSAGRLRSRRYRLPGDQVRLAHLVLAGRAQPPHQPSETVGRKAPPGVVGGGTVRLSGASWSRASSAAWRRSVEGIARRAAAPDGAWNHPARADAVTAQERRDPPCMVGVLVGAAPPDSRDRTPPERWRDSGQRG